MAAPDTKLITYLNAFAGDWLSRMCGPLSVPFAAIAVWWADAPSAKVLWAGLAAASFFLASYRVWRNERNKAAAEVERMQEEREKDIRVLRAEIADLKRKPYDEELGKQGEALLNRLSPDGRLLLRHLVISEPLEIGRSFRADVPQNVQDEQLNIACSTGIVRHNIVRTGNGHIIRQEFVINPPFRVVLQDMLF